MNLSPRDPRMPGVEADARAEGAPGPDRTSASPPPPVSLLHAAGASPAPVTDGAAAVAPPRSPSQAGRPATSPASHAAAGPRVSPPDPYEDLLTGLVGPAVWRRILATESARSARHSRPVTVILVELAGLDAFARRWGPEAATTSVVAMARALRVGCRDADYLARIEIARFGIVLDQADEVEAINCVERLRDACASELRGGEDHLRVGFGWASPDITESLADASRRAAGRLRTELLDPDI